MDALKYADIFCGIGGMRLGFVRACADVNVECECVFSCDIDKDAVTTYTSNFHDKFDVLKDITKVHVQEMPDFDVLLGGFPCQAFSIAGKQRGFLDTIRGTLFFNLAEIIRIKKPRAFLLENVKNLINHNQKRTFRTIIGCLACDLGYNVHYKVLNSAEFGVPQRRERIYIVGFREGGGEAALRSPAPRHRI